MLHNKIWSHKLCTMIKKYGNSKKNLTIMVNVYKLSISTSVNPVHNAPRLSVMGPSFRSTGPGVGVGEGEVCYRQTQPGTPVFRHLTWLGIPGFQPNSAWHSRIST